MSRKQRYIGTLSDKEKVALEKGYKTGKHHTYRRRCHCILLSHGGKSIGELMVFFGVSRQTISTWLNLYEKAGIKGLELKEGRGRPCKLNIADEAQVKKIKTLIKNEPRSLKRVVGQISKDLNIKLSKKTLKRFLKNLITDGNGLESV